MNVLNKLTIKHLKMNKKRTIVTIVGIILSTALMVGIGLLLSTVRENSIDMVKKSSGDHHAIFENINSNDIEYIEKDSSVDKVMYSKKIGFIKYDFPNSDNTNYLKLMEASSNYFDHIELIEGHLPVNDNEIVIPAAISSNYKIGDILSVDICSRYIDGKEIDDNYDSDQVVLKKIESKKLKIVGIIENDVYGNWGSISHSIYSLNNKKESYNVNTKVYVYYKNIKDSFTKTDEISKKITQDSQVVSVNSSLVSLYGASKYDNFMSSMISTLTIVLIILSIGCAVVIYNSFAISVMERKKQFGLLSSIGATKSQIRKTVFFEALIVGIIGIVIGILSSYVGIALLLKVINYMLPNAFGGVALKLVTYPIFIIIPVIFMIITIAFSAFFPSFKASKITPIELVRLNDDIKIKNNKLKTPKIIRKLFGIEGDIAFKNMKRNKKKYRITVLSLFVSIVLFITFSTYMKYMLTGIDSYAGTYEFDIAISMFTNNQDEGMKNINALNREIIKDPNIKEISIINTYRLQSNTDINSKKYYSSKFYELEYGNITKSLDNNSGVNVTLIELDDNTYTKLLNDMGKTKRKPIIYDKYETIKYDKNTRKSYLVNKYSSDFNAKISLCETIYNSSKNKLDCKFSVDDYYISDKEFYGSSLVKPISNMVIIIPNNYYGDLSEFNDGFNSAVYLSMDDDTKFEDEVSKLADEHQVKIYYNNIKEEQEITNNMMFCLNLLVYGFIVLVTLIGITSVFNTINTSINLRRKEFAMLRSMGLTNKGFNKILLFESLFFGIKSLLYSLPVSAGIIYLLFKAFSDMTEFDSILIPYDSILIAILGVFVIIVISTMYATRKIKHENILESLREENI